MARAAPLCKSNKSSSLDIESNGIVRAFDYFGHIVALEQQLAVIVD
jgi:hypothetical protein